MSAVAGLDPPIDHEFDVNAPAAPSVPASTSRADHILPIVIVVSLLVHLTIFLPSLLGAGADTAKRAPREIPIELVQEPPATPKRPARPKPPPAKPVEKPQAQKPAAKPAEPKPAAPKPPAPKREVQKKPEPQKPAPKQPPAQKSVAERMRSLLPISSGALAMPGSAADGTDAVSYEDLVLSRVAKAKDQGRRSDPPAAATVAFLLDEKGGVESVMITQPSGNAWLDNEAIAMIKRGAPYPPPPPGAKRTFQVTLNLHPV